MCKLREHRCGADTVLSSASQTTATRTNLNVAYNTSATSNLVKAELAAAETDRLLVAQKHAFALLVGEAQVALHTRKKGAAASEWNAKAVQAAN